MSYSIDVNLLVYADNPSMPQHTAARRFLERCASDPEPFCLAWPTLMGYLRIVTNPSIFPRPVAPDDALSNIAALLGLPQVRVLTEEEGFLDAYREVTQEQTIRGNLVPDAHLAALLRQNGISKLYTCDNDFRRFRFLEVVDPLVMPEAHQR